MASRVRFASLLVLLSACEAPPALRFYLAGRAVHAHDAGLVTLTQPQSLVFEIENLTQAAVTLRGFVLRGAQSTDGFALLGGNCESALAPHERCRVEVIFDPLSERRHEASLIIRYARDEEERELGLDLSGRGRLDCGVGAALTLAKQQGAANAQLENEARAAQGDSAGSALTHDDGFNKAYANAYQQGHDAGYASGAYEDAYRASYSEGVQDGRGSMSACQAGSSAGANDGIADGVSIGRAEGRAAGEQAGYDEGFTRGEYDGAMDCGSPARDDEASLRSALSQDDQALRQACFTRGREQTLDLRAFAIAYDNAAAKNQAYQVGLSSGFSAGYAAGAEAGATLALSTGDARGYDDGFHAGSSERFADCYDATYALEYQDAYGAGFASVFGYDAGYELGFKDGHADGYASVCG
jgi:flagellar biosynthesis/type III secretory pathway protein FliH